MYLSHPVRRMRDDPISGERVTLVIELGDGDTSELEEIVDTYKGTIDHDLQFADVAVTVPEEAVADLCDHEGIARIETGDTLEQTPSGVEE